MTPAIPPGAAHAAALTDLVNGTMGAVNAHQTLATTYPSGHTLRLHHHAQAEALMQSLCWTLKLAENETAHANKANP